MEGSGQIDGDDVVPLLILHTHEEIVPGYAGIVDQDIEPTHCRLGGGDKLVDLIELGEVTRQDRAILGDFLGRILEGARARTREGNSGAGSSECLGDLATNAAAGTR